MKKNRISRDHQIPFTQVSNALISDERLDLKSIGLFIWMWSKPEDFRFTIGSISRMVKNGKQSIQTSLRELRDHGWLTYRKHKDGSGEYILHLEPKSPKSGFGSEIKFPKPEKPDQGFQDELIIKNINNISLKEKSKKEKEKEDLESLGRDHFEIWWERYQKKVNRTAVEKKWMLLWMGKGSSWVDQVMRHTLEYIKAQPEKEFRKNPLTYLNQESWNDEIIYRSSRNQSQAPRSSAQSFEKLFQDHE